MPSEIDRRVGEHLRRLRKQKGLSLLDVEASSGQEFKASVLGAYERGERAVSAARLGRLAQLYGLPLQAMLPPDGAPSDGAGSLAIDIERLAARQDVPEAQTIARYLRRIQAQRGEWTERVVRVRGEDVRALACAVDRTPPEMIAMLDDIGARAY